VADLDLLRGVEPMKKSRLMKKGTICGGFKRKVRCPSRGAAACVGRDRFRVFLSFF
jgi:hypothetical protein